MSDQPVQERPFGGFSASSGYEGGLQDGAYYNATLTGLKERYIDKGQYPGWKAIWTFAIEGTTETQEAMTSLATGPDSTAGPWIETLVGKARYEAREQKTITMEEMVGRECLLLIKFSDKGWPRVAAVLPRQVTPATAAPVPVQAAPPPVPASGPPLPQPTTSAADFDDLPF